MLLVGLGNPTPTYAHTRHNVGFDILDLLAQDLGVHFIHKAQYCGDYARVGLTHLLKPTTYMNLSGQALRAFLNHHKPRSILIIHDDLDLPLGTLRFKVKGGHGGHNGLKSIMQHCSEPFYKMKIGIGRTQQNTRDATISYVLQRFLAQEEPLKQEIFTHAKQALLFYIKTQDFTAMQNQFTRNT
ncbi:aminoacyl-tRNA hydrolase [Helicobacter suis]|uniref:aminoacyl-tRNA hydrolase n=1 Tax=Helicobacter suis TaxID=104628 RepID=UPI0013D68ACC|nr:aminoacyl-tRNA hydrolase [Helicobacter suis]